MSSKRCYLCDARMDYGENKYRYDEVCRNCGQMHQEVQGSMFIILTEEQKELLFEHNREKMICDDED